jgi:oligoribonuclease NrnB/cAMP/cGMP phosphodiesterase (DHH superfamily)
MPTFLKYIKDRDLWEHKLPYTHEVYAAFGTLGRTFALYDILEDKSEDELIELLVPVGKRVLDDRKKIVDYIASRFEHKTVAGYKNIPVVTIKPGEEVYISDVCESLYLQFPDAPFSACVLDGTKYSLRSNKNGNNTNVASIAKQFGGGGHTNSAGFTVKE